jgi:hypothetical protein
MTDMTPRKMKGSLLERAAKLYDLGAAPREHYEQPEPAFPVQQPAEPQEPAPQPIRGAAGEEAPRPRPKVARPTAAAAMGAARGVASERRMLAV